MYLLNQQQAREKVIEAIKTNKYKIGFPYCLAYGDYFSPFGVVCEEFIENETNFDIAKTYVDDIIDGQTVTAYNKLVQSLPYDIQHWIGIYSPCCSFLDEDSIEHFPMVSPSNLCKKIFEQDQYLSLFKGDYKGFYL